MCHINILCALLFIKGWQINLDIYHSNNTSRLKADRQHPHTFPDHRHTDKYLGLVLFTQIT